MVARGLRKHLYKALTSRAQPFDVVRDSIKLRCHVNDNITEKYVVFGGKYDNAKEMAALLDGLKPGDTFVDVGANCGVFRLTAAKRVGAAGKGHRHRAEPCDGRAPDVQHRGERLRKHRRCRMRDW
jgi:hypothetical protein